MPTPMTLNGAKALREEVAYRKGALRQEITQAIAEAQKAPGCIALPRSGIASTGSCAPAGGTQKPSHAAGEVR